MQASTQVFQAQHTLSHLPALNSVHSTHFLACAFSALVTGCHVLQTDTVRQLAGLSVTQQTTLHVVHDKHKHACKATPNEACAIARFCSSHCTCCIAHFEMPCSGKRLFKRHEHKSRDGLYTWLLAPPRHGEDCRAACG